MSGNKFDGYLRLLAKVFAIGGWGLSIYFSSQGFGLRAGTAYILAGYFLGGLVTLFEIILNRNGKQLPRTLVFICLLAYLYGSVTNVLGLLNGRGSGRDISDWLIAISIGLVLEIFPEPLLAFSLGLRGDDLIDTISGLFGKQMRAPQQYPQYTPPQYVSPHVPRGRKARQQQGRP